MKIETPSDNLILLPGEVKTRLKDASAAELKVLLYLYACKQAEIHEIAANLGLSHNEVESAIAFWRGAGLMTEDTSNQNKVVPQVPQSKSYDSKTIDTYLHKEDFRSCCEIVAEQFGKELTKNDYGALLYLYDYVGLPAEMITGIAAYCISKGKRALQYLCQTAIGMYTNDGIDTYEKFELHMARLEQLNSKIGQVRKMFGFGDRELSKKESEIIGRWFSEWDLSIELVREAYERTVDNLGKIKLSYTNSILKSWYDAGVTTPDEIETKVKKASSSDIAGYDDSDEFFEAALRAGQSEKN